MTISTFARLSAGEGVDVSACGTACITCTLSTGRRLQAFSPLRLKDLSEGCYATTGPEKIVARSRLTTGRVGALPRRARWGRPQTSAFRHGIYHSTHNIYSSSASIRFLYNPPLLVSLACNGQQSRVMPHEAEYETRNSPLQPNNASTISTII